jgi:hypothetical protein
MPAILLDIAQACEAAGNFRNFRKPFASHELECTPWTRSKLPTVSRAKFLQGVSASFRRFPPRRAIVEKAAIS